jgi:hypothetical protein
MLVCGIFTNQEARGQIIPETETQLFDSSNHYLGVCDLTDSSTWTLDKDIYVTTFQIWYSWNSGETTVSFDIKKDGQEFASGEAKKGSCDPYQRQWCNGDYIINTAFPKGTYTAKVSSTRQCKVPGGTGVVRLYGEQGSHSDAEVLEEI